MQFFDANSNVFASGYDSGRAVLWSVYVHVCVCVCRVLPVSIWLLVRYRVKKLVLASCVCNSACLAFVFVSLCLLAHVKFAHIACSCCQSMQVSASESKISDNKTDSFTNQTQIF